MLFQETDSSFALRIESANTQALSHPHPILSGQRAKPYKYILHRSRLGEAILREPRTVSTLLSLILDRRAPPKLVLIILKLCRSALPLMSAKACGEVTLPASAKQYLGRGVAQKGTGPVVRIAKLLLAKLGDFVLPSMWSDAPEVSEDDVERPVGGERPEGGEGEEEYGDVVTLYVHKREDQPAYKVVQNIFRYDPILCSSLYSVITLWSTYEHFLQVPVSWTLEGCSAISVVDNLLWMSRWRSR